MKVLCERDCEKKGRDGSCSMAEISIQKDGLCGQFHKLPEFQPFREDNVVIFDNAGLPSVMVRFSRETDRELFGGTDKPHPMFVIGGEVYDEIYISKYPNVIINGRACSLPMQQPAVNVTLEEAEKACFAKGEGWHLLTAQERGFLALDSLRKGTLPHGNTNYGKYHSNENETGDCFDGCKTLTGSGPATWSHDHTVFGVHDLCGNVWEWCRGLRLMDGALQVAENNDAAMNIDLSETSGNWKPISEEGKPIKLDCTEGEIVFTTCEYVEADYEGRSWKDVIFDCVQSEEIKELALFAGEPEAYIYADTQGERLPLCGGGWRDGSSAGVFDVNLYNFRSSSYRDVGFRSAYYRKR